MTFIGNLAAFLLVFVVCAGFLAWWHLGGGSASVSSPYVQLGVILAAPFLVYALGAILGLIFLWVKKTTVRRVTKIICRVLGIAALAFMLLAIFPVFFPQYGDALLGPVQVVVIIAMAAPILFVVLGVVYAIGCAGVTPAAAKGAGTGTTNVSHVHENED